MENYRIIKPQSLTGFSASPYENREATVSFDEAMENVVRQLEEFIELERHEGRKPVYIRFYLSDTQNQAALLKARLSCRNAVAGSAPAESETAIRKTPEQPGTSIQESSISIVEQPPLDGSRIAALVRTSADADKYLFHSLRLTEEEAAGRDSYAQTRLLFAKYLDIIRPMGLALKTHCIRTWIYVRDIDSNYAGVVRARNDVFAEEGLTHDTHYIASTGIGGATEVRSAVVAMDFLTMPVISEEDKTYLKALDHLSPTHDYGVAFERGVKVNNHIYISGTASIDHRGRILHEGDVVRQTDRLLENISALLSEGNAAQGGFLSATGKGPVRVPQGAPGTGIACPHNALAPAQGGVPYFVIYLRDISDYARIDSYMQDHFPDTPRILLEARVCRPGWLIEMECES